jgi:hypothetical protein
VRRCSIAKALEYWIAAFAGMTAFCDEARCVPRWGRPLNLLHRRAATKAVIARLFLDRATQYSRAPMFNHESPGILGHPLTAGALRRAAAGGDNLGGATCSAS